MKLKVIAVFWLIFFAANAQAERISGKIIDIESGDAVAFANVFINGSTFSTQSNEIGDFILEGGFTFPAVIVFQSLGFETKSLRLNKPSDLPVPVKLNTKAKPLDEFVVTAPARNGWELYGADFFMNFIGYSPFAKECEIVNKKDIEFRYKTTLAILYVSAEKPIQIVNKALGYTIFYQLEDFNSNKRTGAVYYKGYSRFEPMKPKNKKQMNKWINNRKSAYYGSINHFMRSVYRKDCEKEGFQLNVVIRGTSAEYGTRVPLSKDTFSNGDSIGIAVILKNVLSLKLDSLIDYSKIGIWNRSLLQWSKRAKISEYSEIEIPLKDGLKQNPYKLFVQKISDLQSVLKFFDTSRIAPRDSAKLARSESFSVQMLKGSDTEAINKMQEMKSNLKEEIGNRGFDYLYSLPWPIDSFVNYKEEPPKLFFKDIIQVMYKPELEEDNYLAAKNRFENKQEKPGPQTSFLVFIAKKPINVYADGNYFESYDLFLEGYWSYEKLDKLLPLDFEP